MQTAAEAEDLDAELDDKDAKVQKFILEVKFY